MTRCLGAYLGTLLNDMMDADPSAAIQSSYVFRQACGVLLVNDQGEHFDGGEVQLDCMEFFEKLVGHLDEEEVADRPKGCEAPSLVRELFGLNAVIKVIQHFDYSQRLHWLCARLSAIHVVTLGTLASRVFWGSRHICRVAVDAVEASVTACPSPNALMSSLVQRLWRLSVRAAVNRARHGNGRS